MRATPCKGPAADGFRRFLQLIAVGALALCHSTPVLACGESDRPYRIVREVLPADGAKAFPRNGAVQVQLDYVYPSPRVTTMHEQPRVRVVRVDDGSEVGGTLDIVHLESAQRFTWAPLELLAANTVYRVEVASMPSPRDDIAGETTSVTTFETSEIIAPELELSSELQVSLRAELVPVSKCGPCGMGCVPVSERRALMADFTLPQVSGGFADYGYTAWLGQTDREPPTFDGPGEGTRRFDGDGIYMALAPGKHDVVTMEIFPESTITCLNFNAWDAARQAKSAASICIPRSEIDAVFAKLAVGAADGGAPDNEDAGAYATEPSDAEHAADGGVADDEPSDAKPSRRKPSKHNFSCSAGPEPTGIQPGVLASMMICSLWLTVRRRRTSLFRRH